jgi:predicted transcriptional regulator
MLYKALTEKIMISNEDFILELKKILIEKNMTALDFSKKTKIPESTLYKILSNPKKDFRISTLRQIINTVREMEESRLKGYNIAIITTREALDSISKSIKVKDKTIKIKEYPANTIEEEIIQGIHAQKEGVKGIICGPVAATTIEKVVDIPVISIKFDRELLIKSIKNISNKI